MEIKCFAVLRDCELKIEHGDQYSLRTRRLAEHYGTRPGTSVFIGGIAVPSNGISHAWWRPADF